MSGNEYLATMPEAAEVLGVCKDTAYELLRRGEFPVPVVRVGRCIKVPRKPLLRFVETGTVEEPGGMSGLAEVNR